MIIIKTLIQSYSFNALAKTITINDIPNFDLENLLVITNVTDGIIIYNFADSNLNASVAANVIALEYDTSAMADTDSLQIFMDIPTLENIYEQYPLTEQYTYDTNMSNVLGSQPLTDKDRLKSQTNFMENKVKGILRVIQNELSIDCSGMQTVSVQLSGTWSGTITFEGTSDGGNYVAINNLPLSSVNPTQTTTANGITRCNVAALSRFRVRMTTYSSGTASCVLTASSALSGINMFNTISGSTGVALQQKVTTNELQTYDTNIVATTRPGFAAYDPIVAPTINPTQPTTYAANNFANYPQKLPRIRVEIGGDQKLPLAQEPNTNRLMVSNDDARRLLEDILYQLMLLNQNYSTVNNLDTKLEMNSDKK